MLFSRVVIAVVYWYVWIQLLPRLRGYTWEEEMDHLDDGTPISRLAKVRDYEQVPSDEIEA